MTNTNHTRRSGKSFDRPIDRLQVTPEYAEVLYEREKEGEELTSAEKRICNVAYATEMAEQFMQLVAYAGFDVAIGKPAAWEIGDHLRNAPTVGQQAVGYQYMLSVVLETSGALEGIITKLWSDLGRLPLSLEDIDAVTTAGATGVRHG